MTVPNEATPELIPMATRPADPPHAGWAAVYRLYSSNNELLYIGSTINAPQRWSHHKSTKDWWPTVAAYTLTWQTDAEQAYAEEYKAIRAEQPRLNKLGVFPFGEAQPTSEAAMRVIAAMDAVEAIEDPEHRARVISEITAIQAERSSRWREMRREAVVQMRTAGTSYRKIATLLGVSLGTVQDIERGHSGAWGTKSRRKPATT